MPRRQWPGDHGSSIAKSPLTIQRRVEVVVARSRTRRWPAARATGEGSSVTVPSAGRHVAFYDGRRADRDRPRPLVARVARRRAALRPLARARDPRRGGRPRSTDLRGADHVLVAHTPRAATADLPARSPSVFAIDLPLGRSAPRLIREGRAFDPVQENIPRAAPRRKSSRRSSPYSPPATPPRRATFSSWVQHPARRRPSSFSPCGSCPRRASRSLKSAASMCTRRSRSTVATESATSGSAATSRARRSPRSAPRFIPMVVCGSASRRRGRTAPTPSCSSREPTRRAQHRQARGARPSASLPPAPHHGVLASRAAVRAEVVLGREPASPPPQLPLLEPSEEPPLEPPPPARHPWAWLLERVLNAEVTTCPVEGRGGRMRLVEIATDPDDIARVLLREPRRARAPPTRRPPPRGQLSLAFG